jgi:ribonuclease PH
MRKGRLFNQIRDLEIVPSFNKWAEGSALISMGNTKVLCTATVEEKVPPFIKDKQDSGWVTAEYNMLPRATHSRTQRERSHLGGRTQEIQRLIGRSMRSIVELSSLGQRTIILDCDVLQADGGTRTASINGAYVAMLFAMKNLFERGLLKKIPVFGYVAAVSVGKIEGQCLLDLAYEEDSRAEVDMNVVMTDMGEFIELQGTGEAAPFTESDLKELLSLAKEGISSVIDYQKQIVGDFIKGPGK